MPILGAVLIAILSVAPMMMAHNAMRDAVSSGAQYVMAGGTDAAAVRDLTLSAWSRRPTDGAVTVSTYCTCAGVATACTTLCNGTPPQRFTSIQATMLYHGVAGDQALVSQQTLRTR